MSLLGLDVGTTGCKAVVFSEEGRQLASAYREYPLRSPQPGWQELDPDEVWSAVREVLGEAASKTAKDPIKALGISSQGEACHAVDREGNCLTPSVVTFDARTALMPEWWEERLPRYELGKITGMPLHGMYSLNKILWFKEHRPDVYANAWKFLCYEDFVHMRLGIEPTMSHSLAARTMAFDVNKGEWSDKVLGLADVDRGLLADTAPAGSVVGSIPDSVADEIGLPRDVTVVTGGHDQPAGALGAGIVSPGEALYATGTVECICPVFESLTITEETISNNLCCYPACLPGSYASIAFNFTGGSLLKWFRDNFAHKEMEEAARTNRDVYDILCGNVRDKPENVLILPHFTVTGTPHFDTRSLGAMAGLTLETPREEIVSAILSGVIYEMKCNLDLLQSAGVEISQLRASGGGAKSPVWVQRKADITGIPVAVLETEEAPSLGVAMLAGQASGAIGDLRDILSDVVKIARVCEPNEERHEAYQERFALYQELYPALREINHRLSDIRSR